MKTKRLAAALIASLAPLGAHAQVATDGSVGARVTLTGPSYGIPDFIGLRVGPNLLHSFSVFNLPRGESAVFSSVGGIQNIVARITGGTASTIDGTIHSTTTSSNLFLVNPAGIVFGPGASINVRGSFYASTAHYLRFADGTTIEMRATPGVSLTAAPPSAFGFQGTSAAVSLRGAQLRVVEGQRLGIAAGEVLLSRDVSGRATVLSAASGTIGLLGAQSAGEATIVDGGFRADGFGAMGRVSLGPGSLVSVNEGAQRRGGGAVSIAGSVVDVDHANVESRTRFGGGRGIAIGAAEAINVIGGNVVSVTTGAGNAGALQLQSRDITISGGALVDTSCDPGCTTGAGGPLSVSASGTLRLVGDNATTPTYLVSNSFGGGNTGAIDIRADALVGSGNAFIQGITQSSGNGTSITIDTGSIALSGGAQVDASTRGTGRGGNITIANAGAITLDGTRIADPATNLKLPSGFFANTESSGSAGSIVVSTATLEVLGGAEVSSTARARSTGSGGRVAVSASGTVRVSGTDADGKSSGIVSNAFSSGNAGDVEVTADRVEVSSDGRIQTQSEGSGRAGAVRIRANSMALTGRGQVSSDARAGGDGGDVCVELTGRLDIAGANSGLFAKTYGPARGGAVSVTAGSLAIDGGGVFAGTDGTGRGGDVSVRTTGDATVSNRGSISVESRAGGNAGTLSVASDGNVLVNDSASITARTTSSGAGGSVTVTAGRSLTVQDDGRIGAETLTSGLGGAVAVHAGETLTLQREGRLTSESTGTGLAGTITAGAGGTVAVVDGGRIATSARQADGGDVLVTAGEGMAMSSGRITTEVGTGRGSGGNVTVRVPTLVMSDSLVTANAFGGDGGNVLLSTITFVPSANSRVTASSTLGIDGIITLESPALDPTRGLLLPPPSFVDVGAVLSGRCGPRLAGRASSLVVLPAAVARAPDGWRLGGNAGSGACAPAEMTSFLSAAPAAAPR